MGIDRRDVIKFIVGGAVASSFTPVPWLLTDDISIWTQNWPWIPRNVDGESTYEATVSKLCPSNCGVKVRMVHNRPPVRSLGDENSPLSGGGLTALAAAEVQMLYSPARVRRPLRRSSDGAYAAITWAEAEAILQEKLGNTSDVAMVSGDKNGAMNDVLTGFVKGLGSEACYAMPEAAQTASVAFNGLMGGEGQPAFDFEGADYVLAIGADILESWGPVAATRVAYAAMRPHGEAPHSTYVYAGAFQTNTAAGSDMWVPMKPGAQAALAMGLANLLIQKGATADAADFEDFKVLAAQYTPEKVQADAGVSPDQLTKLAEGLAAAKKPLVVVGPEGEAGLSPAAFVAGSACNMLLGALQAVPYPEPVVPGAMDRGQLMAGDFVAAMVNAAGGDAPEALILYQANPVYSLPGSVNMAEAMKNVGFSVCFSTYLTETALASDLVLPVPHSLETLDDVETPYGYGKSLMALARPLTPTLVDAKHPGDFLLGLSRKLGADLGYGDYQELLTEKAAAFGADFKALMQGETFVKATASSPAGLSLAPDALSQAMAAESPKTNGDVRVFPLAKLNFGQAASGLTPFSLKTIREYELDEDYMYVQMNAATAARFGAKQGTVVKLTSPVGEIAAKVGLHEGVMNDVVVAPLNLGHTAFDEFTRDKGANAHTLFAASVEPGSEYSVWAGQTVSIAKL